MNTRRFGRTNRNIRTGIGTALAGALLVALAPSASATDGNPDPGQLIGTDFGYTAGQTFSWIIPTPDADRIIVAVDNEDPVSAADTCAPAEIAWQQGTSVELASPGDTQTIAFTLTHPGDHILTAIDADTGESLAVNSIYARDDGSACAAGIQLLDTGERNSTIAPVVAGTTGVLAVVGTIAFFGNRRRAAASIPAAVITEDAAHL